MIRFLQIAVLSLGRFPPLQTAFQKAYDLALWFACLVLHGLPQVDSVLLRGSYVSGRLVPGLSDLDFEVIVHPFPDAEATVRGVQAIHQRGRWARRLFPFVQAPFIRSRSEWQYARTIPHEWLTHSRWATSRGSLEVRPPDLQLEQDSLGLFRLCLRELTKTLPHTLFATPADGTLHPTRLNRDRLEALQRLSTQLCEDLPEIQAMRSLEEELAGRNFLSRRSRSTLTRYTVCQFRCLERLAGKLLSLKKDEPAPELLGPPLEAPEELLELRDELQTLLSSAWQVLTSSGGARYSQFKLYLIPPSTCGDEQMAESVSLVVGWWRSRRTKLSASLSYGAPILLPKALLNLVHLGFCSSFEAAHLRVRGLLSERTVPFLSATIARESVDGVFLLRKKYALLRDNPDRFVRYLQDYFVGVYPALSLARNEHLLACSPEAATRAFVTRAHGPYAELLEVYQSRGLYRTSLQAIREEPKKHLKLLEQFHRELLDNDPRP